MTYPDLRKSFKLLIAGIVAWVGTHFPHLVRSILWICGWAHFRYPRFLITQLANAVNFRMYVVARLRNGMKLRVVWNDWVGYEIFRRGYYDSEGLELVCALLNPGMVFFDIGAHVGQYSLVVSQALGLGGQVHSFEPDPDTFRCLEENVRVNKAANIYLNNLALSAKKGCGSSICQSLLISEAILYRPRQRWIQGRLARFNVRQSTAMLINTNSPPSI